MFSDGWFATGAPWDGSLRLFTSRFCLVFLGSFDGCFVEVFV